MWYVRKYPPATVSQITWLSPEKIEEAAGFYARSKPACIQWGNAVDHGVNSFQTARAISLLRAITGNLDVIGGDLLPSYPLAGQGASDITLRHRIGPQVWEKRIGAEQNQLPLFRRVLPKILINAIIETQRGRVKQKAFLSESLHPQVVCADFGWWFPEEAKHELHGWKASNLNIIIDDRFPDSPETGSLNLRGLLCRVYKEGNQ